MSTILWYNRQQGVNGATLIIFGKRDWLTFLTVRHKGNLYLKFYYIIIHLNLNQINLFKYLTYKILTWDLIWRK